MANNIGNVHLQPYWLKTPDLYEISTERQNHDDAIYAYGEYSMFALLWNANDFEAGLCERCPYCVEQYQEIAEVYKQGSVQKCPICFGSTFWKASAAQLGGLRARIIRAALWDADDEAQKQVAQGVMTTSTSRVQSTSDFRMRSGDFVFRADKTRWRIQAHETTNIISGFQAADDIRTMIGYDYPSCQREDESGVSFLIPPDVNTITPILDISVIPNYPVDFSQYEIVNGPLIADDFAA